MKVLEYDTFTAGAVSASQSTVVANPSTVPADGTTISTITVTLKDANTGLVDFLGERDGEVVELCWRLGEDRVANWHRVGEGFPGRKPL